MMRYLVAAGAIAASASTGAPAGPAHVAIVIAGDKTACVAWHSGMTGDDVLNAAATVHYRRDGLIDAIDGRPSPPHADDTHFWAYWHETASGWTYGTVGPSAYHPRAGDVEGWAFGDKARPPAVAYSDVCHDPAATRSPAHHGSSTGPAVGAVSGLLAAGVLGGAAFWLMRRRRAS